MFTRISKNKILFSFFFFFLTFLAGFRPVGLDRDSINYLGVIHVGIESANYIDKEPFFWILTYLNQIVFGGNVTSFFVVFATLGVFFKLYSIKKMSLNPNLSLFLYICVYFVLHEMTQIRIGVAAGIFLLAVRDFYDKNEISFFFKLLLASLFHYSSIVGLLLFFLPRKGFSQVFYIALPVIGFIFSILIDKNAFINIVSLGPSFISEKIILYYMLSELGEHATINKLNVYYLTLSFIYFFLALNFRVITDGFQLFMLKILGVAIFCFYFFSFMPVLAFRISEFLGVVVIILLGSVSFYFRPKFVYVVFICVWGATIFVSQSVMNNLNLGVLL